jgi:glycosyltransferase involved in cell wall biosynthesis
MKSLKIIFHCGEVPSTTFIEALSKNLASRGHHVFMLGKKKSKYASIENNIHLLLIQRNNFLLFFQILIQLFRLLVRDKHLFVIILKRMGKKLFQRNSWNRFLLNLYIFNTRADILHIQWAKAIREFEDSLDLIRAKTLLSFRGAHINYSPLADKELAQAYRDLFPQIDGFHAVSQAIAQRSLRYHSETEKIHVIHPAVSRELLAYPHVRTVDPVSELKIISVGRMHWKKGYNYALDAMGMLKEQSIRFRYCIIGGKADEHIVYQIHDMGLHDSVDFLDFMPQSRLITYLAGSHVFLLPSVEEGIANVVLEAMALGIPVISTDCGGMKEVIQDGLNGFLVPVRSAEAIRDRITHFMTLSPEKKALIVDEAKKTIRNRFLWEAQSDAFEKLYFSLLEVGC